MPQLTSPPRTERPTTPSVAPAPPGAFPPWLATAGGVAVLAAASLWIPPLVTLVLGLAVLALSAAVLHRAATAAGAGGGHGLAGLVTAALGLLLAGLLSLPGGLPDQGGGLALDFTPPAGATPAPDPAPPAPSETTPPSTPEAVQLRPVAVEASATAAPSVDGAGRRVTFEPPNVVDGRMDTAWRVEGDGIGHTLTFRFDQTVHLQAIGLLPGYAKVDPVSGTDRFTQNRRVTKATYHVDSPPPVRVEFTDVPDLQWVDVGADTTAVVVEITGSTEAAERDYTAIAEVQFTGWPTG